LGRGWRNARSLAPGIKALGMTRSVRFVIE
jgi:hypothetical protein